MTQTPRRKKHHHHHKKECCCSEFPIIKQICELLKQFINKMKDSKPT